MIAVSVSYDIGCFFCAFGGVKHSDTESCFYQHAVVVFRITGGDGVFYRYVQMPCQFFYGSSFSVSLGYQLKVVGR